ncbi:MAG TPA: bifunctional phosphoglucose/phosphomannose isomerase [Solirubrobacterales bacterium]|nr:bifunctional phosphoglucose/phosphomannose isomerase [Solirubrobacterales bacterium]
MMNVIGGSMLDAVKALPEHLRDALWRIETARAPTMEAPAAFVCGMGGSAIGGDLAAAALFDRLTKPMLVARGYELPSWAPPGSAVLCSSYSGDTEETLACYAAAEAVGAQRLVATTGGELAEAARRDGVPVIGLPAGLQPRAAVGYTFCVAAELAALALAGPRINTEIDGAASHLSGAVAGAESRATEIAEQIGDAVPVIFGSDLTAPVAYRWKTQVNENAKSPAYSAVLPEADHNELEGWSGADDRFAAVLVEDRDQHPRERRRFELTAKAIEPRAAAVIRLETEGETRTERLLHAVLLGDLVSVELANARGVDPMPVESIESFKRELGRPEAS